MRSRIAVLPFALGLVALPLRAQDADVLDDDGATPASYEELASAPPALPASTDPASLHAALSPAQRATVDEDMRVVTFAQRIRKSGGTTELEGFSIGSIDLPPDSLRAILADVAAYPAWVRFHPSYKSVRVDGGSRMSIAAGSADAPKAKRDMTYAVAPSPDGARWSLVASSTPLQPGSAIELTVAAHPAKAGASLVVHRQVGVLPDGRMLKYLGSADDKGLNRWWKDCNRHARRLHWALAVAGEQPPGREREIAYVTHHQREFWGRNPYWYR